MDNFRRATADELYEEGVAGTQQDDNGKGRESYPALGTRIVFPSQQK